MRISKNISESQLTSVEVVTPSQADTNGRMWASELLTWIEKMATFTAQIHAEVESVVAVHLEQMNFKQSLRASEQVVLTSRVVRVGKSSMDIEVLVDRQTDDKRVQRGTIARALLTLVSLDRLGKPSIVPGLTLETDEEKYLFAESNLRLRIKKRLERFVENRNLLRLKNLSKINFSKKTISEIVNVLGA